MSIHNFYCTASVFSDCLARQTLSSIVKRPCTVKGSTPCSSRVRVSGPVNMYRLLEVGWFCFQHRNVQPHRLIGISHRLAHLRGYFIALLELKLSNLRRNIYCFNLHCRIWNTSFFTIPYSSLMKCYFGEEKLNSLLQ